MGSFTHKVKHTPQPVHSHSFLDTKKNIINMPRKFFVGGNFKMNGNTESLTTVMNGINNTKFDPATVDVVVGAPACYLPLCHGLADASKCKVAAENVHTVT